MQSFTGKYNLRCSQQLDETILAELDSLATDCIRKDKNCVILYKPLLSQLCTFPRNILCYQQQKLIGIASRFFFYEDALEISILVAPLFRRQGIARKMLRQLLSFPTLSPITKLIFSSPHKLNDEWLLADGYTFLYSQHQMQYTRPIKEYVTNPSTSIRLATQEDIPTLCAIDELCFPDNAINLSSRFFSLLSDSTYKIFVLMHNDKLIGKVHLCHEPDGLRLSDFSISQELQGQGFGQILLSHCIKYAQEQDNMQLQLDLKTTNLKALKLYSRFGFTINNTCDFWQIDFLPNSQFLL